MKTSRQRLLEYIQAHRIVTASDLSRALRMTQANARHHLALLEEQGLVEVVGQHPGSGRGRPARLFSLSEQALGHNLDNLASALLDQFLGDLPPESRAEYLQQVARRMQGGGITPGGSLTQRLYQAVQRLNDLKYQARWEAHAEAPRLILSHCPYAAILPQHPELCRMDAQLLEGLLEAPVQQTAKLAKDRRGATYCMFMVGIS